jgi:putative hydrolase of HD superfamily
MDGQRYENDAEHSWHLAAMAVVLAEHACEPVNIARVVRMVLVHDIVEIDAGDTFCYDPVGARDKLERETKAAERLFGILPKDQSEDLRSLWEEFESRATPDARYAAALDRLHPLLHNFRTGGAAWRQHGVTAGMVVERNRHIREGSPALWTYAEALIKEAVRRGYLSP